jgi:hypothetical protein
MQVLPHSPRRIALTALGGALLGMSIALPAMAMSAVSRAETAFEVTGADSRSFAGLVPGDRAPTQVIEMRATGSVTYQVSVEWDGSEALASVLEMTLTDTAGDVLYSGPLSDVRIAADAELADGQIETIAVVTELPISAGNEIQGAALTARVVIQATGSTD